MKIGAYYLLMVAVAASQSAATHDQKNRWPPRVEGFVYEPLLLDNPITADYLNRNLSHKSPKLFLTPEVEANLREKIKSDPLVKKAYQSMREDARKTLEMPLIERRIVGFRMRGTATSLHRRLSNLSMVYRIDRDQEILTRIDAELLAASAYPDWNPQHFLDIGELAFGVALAVDWVGEDLPEETVRLVKKALIEKAIDPSFNHNGIRMGWINDTNNWTTINHTGVMAAALVTADVDAELAAKAISRGLERLSYVLNDYAPDGAYTEGPKYYRYGTGFMIKASEILTSALGTDFGIADYPGLVESASYLHYVTAPSGRYFNYGDSSGGGGKAGMWFAMKTGNGLFFDEASHESLGSSGRALGGPGLIQFANYTPQEITELPRDWCGQGPNPIAVFRGKKEDPSQFYLAVKGGTGSCSHGNLDAGTFIFELNGVRWVIDLGNQSYEPLNKIGLSLGSAVQTSSRWSLLTKRNQGHSTITVNDSLFDVYAYAPITDFKPSGHSEVTIDLTDMYFGNLDSLERTFVRENDQSLLIEDRVIVNELTETVTWTLMTVADVEPTESGAVLKQDGKELQLSIVGVDSLKVDVVPLDPPPLPYDLRVEGLKRIEIRVPANHFADGINSIRVRLAGKK